MDGKVNILNAQELLNAQESAGDKTLPTTQFFESQTACGDSAIVKVEGKLYMVSGFDDGVICLIEMHKMNGASMERPVVSNKKGDKMPEPLNEGIYEQWHEQAYEHCDSIISVEANAAESTEAAPVRLLTASKDGGVYLWAILGDSVDPDDRLSYVDDAMIEEPLTRAKWLTPKCIIVSTTHGNLYTMELSKDSQNVECLMKPQLVYSTTHDVAIWDMAVLSANGAAKVEVWVAEDSGKVNQLTLNASTKQVESQKTVHVSKFSQVLLSNPFPLFLYQQFANESALSVGLDILRTPSDQNEWMAILTLGSNSKVVVLEKPSGQGEA